MTHDGGKMENHNPMCDEIIKRSRANYIVHRRAIEVKDENNFILFYVSELELH